MTILSKYIARDVLAAIASVAIVLLLIILGKLFIQLLGKVCLLYTSDAADDFAVV